MQANAGGRKGGAEAVREKNLDGVDLCVYIKREVEVVGLAEGTDARDVIELLAIFVDILNIEQVFEQHTLLLLLPSLHFAAGLFALAAASHHARVPFAQRDYGPSRGSGFRLEEAHTRPIYPSHSRVTPFSPLTPSPCLPLSGTHHFLAKPPFPNARGVFRISFPF